MIISTDKEKAFNKNIQKLGIEENFLDLIKGTYKTKQNTSNIIFSGERLNAFSLSSERRKECHLL